MGAPAKHGGRLRTVDVREVLSEAFHVLSTDCQWSALPKDLPSNRCSGRHAGCYTNSH
jgi:transposase